MAARQRFTVSGPDIDRGYPDGGPALSAAITFAARASREATYYVRDPAGDPYGRAEADGLGRVLVYRKENAK